MKGAFKIVGLLLVLLGIALGVYWHVKAGRDQAERAKGEDVAGQVLSSCRRDGSCYVTVKYETIHGDTRTKEVEVPEDVYFTAQEHNRIEMSYDKDNPDKVFVGRLPYELSQRYVIAVVIAAVGVVLLVLSSRGGGI